jgi:hypothetical protein
MPFVPKFCPVKFGWENALMLNCMQQKYEDDNNAEWIARSLFYEGRFSSIHGCLLNDCHFSEPSGTVADADRLSLQFLRFSGHIDYRISSELSQIFTVGVKGTSLLLDEGVERKCDVYGSIMHLRKDLFKRFFFIDPLAENSVFSSSRYGHRNALVLNALQQIEQLRVHRTGSSRLRVTVFTRPSGSDFEADHLSFEYCNIPSRLCDFLFHTDDLGSPFKGVFLIDEKKNYWHGYHVIEEELTLLRAGLFSIPRFTAFMMVRHSRLGAGSALAALGDDVCRMILKLSIE